MGFVAAEPFDVLIRIDAILVISIGEQPKGDIKMRDDIGALGL